MEDEENCKEEWSKRKKNKISYIKPSKIIISKAFSSIISKSDGEMNVIEGSMKVIEGCTHITSCKCCRVNIFEPQWKSL